MKVFMPDASVILKWVLYKRTYKFNIQFNERI
jgi:hypothetical protein